MSTPAALPEAYVPENTPPYQHLTNRDVAVDKNVEYNYNVRAAPLNQKLILLTKGKIGVFGCLYGDARDSDIIGWFPMPARNKELEKQLGIL